MLTDLIIIAIATAGTLPLTAYILTKVRKPLIKLDFNFNIKVDHNHQSVTPELPAPVQLTDEDEDAARATMDNVLQALHSIMEVNVSDENHPSRT
jgi:hypothetical protein